MSSDQPIGVYDSGLGGLSIALAIQHMLPHERLRYVADAAHLPYGEKDPAVVQQRAEIISDYFVSRQVKAIVVACNTATAAAIAAIRERHPQLIIIGVEPAIKPAAHLTRSGVIGVCATTGTLASAKFAALVQLQAPEIRILLQPCPRWIGFVENGELSGPRVQHAIAESVQPLLAANADTLVLGCTHFPFLTAAIQAEVGPAIPLLETGAPVARWLRHQLALRKQLRLSLPGELVLETTGDAQHFAHQASRLLNTACTATTLAPVWC